MTRLVVDPATLKATVPAASLTNEVRIRLIVQVVEYLVTELPTLVVTRIPNLEPQGISGGGFASVDVSLMENLDSDVFYGGSLIDIDALYNGETIVAVASTSLHGVSPSQLTVLLQMSSLNPIEV